MWENMAFEVLLEIEQSRKEVFITAETASATIKQNLPSTDVLLAPFDKLETEEVCTFFKSGLKSGVSTKT